MVVVYYFISSMELPLINWGVLVFHLLLWCIVSRVQCIVIELPGYFNGSCITCDIQLTDPSSWYWWSRSSCRYHCDSDRKLQSISQCVYGYNDWKCQDFLLTCRQHGFPYNRIKEECTYRRFGYTDKKEQLRIVGYYGVYQFTCTNRSTVLTRKNIDGSAWTRPACIEPVAPNQDTANKCLNDSCSNSASPTQAPFTTKTETTGKDSNLTSTGSRLLEFNSTTEFLESILEMSGQKATSEEFSLQHILLISILSLGIVMLVLFLLVQLQRRALSSWEQEPWFTWTRHQHGGTVENQHGGDLTVEDGIYETIEDIMEEPSANRHQDGGLLENQDMVENGFYETREGAMEENEIYLHPPNQHNQ